MCNPWKLWWEAYISQAYVPHQHLETALQINQALSTNCNKSTQYQKVVFWAKREVFHFTKTNKDDISSLYTQIWFHYTSNNSLSAGTPVSQLYLVKLLCYAQKPLEDMHGDSDRINRRMSSSLRCFPCLVIIAHNNFHRIGATGFIAWDESTASTLYVKKHTLPSCNLLLQGWRKSSCWRWPFPREEWIIEAWTWGYCIKY